MRTYVICFYGIEYEFKVGLKQDLAFAEQPYGLIGSSVDLSGRRAVQGKKPLISYSGKKIVSLERPDVAYASLSVSSIGMGDAGEDLYQNTLFFMTGKYDLLAKTSVIAGRDIEDCCSPEIYHELYKVKLGEVNPLKRMQEKDMITGAVPASWTVSVSPEIVSLVEIRFDADTGEVKKFDELIDELYINLCI